MRTSIYRITASDWATGHPGPWDQIPADRWHGGLEYRVHANTPRGIRRQVNALIRDFAGNGERPILDTTVLDASNNPADGLFAPGRRAKLQVLPWEELERTRVTWRNDNPHSPYTYGRVFIHVYRGRFEH